MKVIALAILSVGMGYISCKFGDSVAGLIAIVAALIVFFYE